MHCRGTIWTSGLVCALALVGPSSAQVPGPYSYDTARAYSHFLTSPYSYRTYSATVMPYRVEAYTPYSHERFTTGPGYIHQRITPHGFESYYTAPSWSYRVTRYPLMYVYLPATMELRPVPAH